MGDTKKTRENFIIDAKGFYGDYYDYSRVDYKGCKVEVEIGCPKHGFFWQTPDLHFRSKIPCPECRRENKRITRTHTTEEFIVAAIQKHGNFYDYSQVDYTRSRDKVKIGCPEHGFFWQTPQSHLRKARKNNTGCPECGRVRSHRQFHTTKQFIASAIKTYGNYFDYSRVDYKGNKVKVEIGCPRHGFFWQSPEGHLRKAKTNTGCPECGRAIAIRLYTDDPTILYYIKVTDLDGVEYWKIGITKHTLKHRFNHKDEWNHIEVVWTKPYSTGKDAWLLEQQILNRYNKYRLHGPISVLRDGYTEIFTRNVLHYVPVTWDGSLGVMPRV
jgi:Zn finger protein HypA/HybF involved in hydrogenase expression